MAPCCRTSELRVCPGRLRSAPSRLAEQFRNSVRKLHGVPQVGGPIDGIGRLIGLDPGAGEVGDKRDLWSSERHSPHRGDERLEERRPSSPEWNACDVLPPEAPRFGQRGLLERCDELLAAGDHALRRGVDGGERKAIAHLTDAGAAETASIAPGGHFSISRPRMRDGQCVVERKTSARHAATYSPMLCPSIACGRTPSDIHHRASAYSTENRAGCVKLVRFRTARLRGCVSAGVKDIQQVQTQIRPQNPAHRSRQSRKTGWLA